MKPLLSAMDFFTALQDSSTKEDPTTRIARRKQV